MREALEQALVDNPADVATHAAYADWLTEQGDPRGEFISVQLSLEGELVPPEERDKLLERGRELLDAHAREWLGDLAPVLLDGQGLYAAEDVRAPQWRFRRGWLSSLGNLWLAVPAARVIARSPQVRLLEELAVEYACGEDETDPWEPGDDVPDDIQFVSLFPLLRSPYLGNVRRLRLGFDPEVTGESSYAFGHAAADLVAMMPRIEELRLFTRGVDAKKLFALPTLTHLRRLDYHHDRAYPLHVLAANPALARLEVLDLFPHYFDPQGDEDGSHLPYDSVVALFSSPHLTSLRHLALRESDMGDPGVAALVASPMLARLRLLDLSHGAVTDEGARLLAEHARHLERLDLTDNALTAAGVCALQRAGIPVRAGDQHEPGDDRYLYVGEFE
jgi:uncharacterized protein (TIGR02996 family)